jgi:hypothetical protein
MHWRVYQAADLARFSHEFEFGVFWSPKQAKNWDNCFLRGGAMRDRRQTAAVN